MNKFVAIQTFIAIADNGSLTEAALRLDKSLPTVVRVLADLEKHLGVRLFNRSTRRIDLTDEGRIYLSFCRQMMSGLDRVESELLEDPRSPGGLVSVTAPLFFGELHVGPALSSIAALHQGLSLRLHLADRLVNILDEHIDLAVRIGHLRDSQLRTRTIGVVDQVLCASPSFLEKSNEITSPDELTDRPCILNVGNNAGTTWRFQTTDGDDLHVSVTGQFMTNTVRPALDACVAGQGYGLFLSYQVANQLKAGKLRILLPEFQPPPLPVQLVHGYLNKCPLRVSEVIEKLALRLRPVLSAVSKILEQSQLR